MRSLLLVAAAAAALLVCASVPPAQALDGGTLVGSGSDSFLAVSFALRGLAMAKCDGTPGSPGCCEAATCPYKNGVCCGGNHCCPAGTVCLPTTGAGQALCGHPEPLPAPADQPVNASPCSCPPPAPCQTHTVPPSCPPTPPCVCENAPAKPACPCSLKNAEPVCKKAADGTEECYPLHCSCDEIPVDQFVNMKPVQTVPNPKTSGGGDDNSLAPVPSAEPKHWLNIKRQARALRKDVKEIQDVLRKNF